MEYILKNNPDGSVITVRDVQNVLLEMLKDIDAICRKNHIPYFLNKLSLNVYLVLTPILY